jgi:tetratricopeptide (TPR) repeat protein
MLKKYTPYVHPRKAQCLCGSGLKFKRCCFDIYQKERDVGASSELFNNKKYKEALIQCRADITRYTIWHRSHTEPPLKDGYEPIYEILDIDIKALSEMVRILFKCHERLNLLKEFPAVLDRLRENIKVERWRHHIVYFQTLCALSPNWNVKTGRHELKKIGSIEEVNDVEILQLFCELELEEFNFTEKLKLIDKILNLSEKWIDVLQYQSLKATQFLLINDIEEAKSLLIGAVKEARKNIDNSITAYEALRTGETMLLLSPLINDEDLALEAVSLLKKSLEFEYWTSAGEALIYREIGDARKRLDEWEQAKENYAKSLELSPHNVSQVFLAECYLYTEQLSEAKALLDEVLPEKLTYPNYCDYVFVHAVLSIASGDTEELNNSEKLLHTLEFKEPLFRERQQSLLISVLKCKANCSNENIIKRAFAVLKGVMRSANRYLIFQPNFMGIGINLNKVVEDSEKVHRERIG